jgi:hypothetical protein
MCTSSVAVCVFAGHQLELAFETITSPEFLKKSFGVIIALLFVHIILLVLPLLLRLRRVAVVPMMADPCRRGSCLATTQCPCCWGWACWR